MTITSTAASCYFSTTLLLLVCFMGVAQKPSLSKMSAIDIDISHDKTTHLLFDSAISYVDLGNKDLVASMLKDAPNVLRLKATHQHNQLNTNFSVICQNGEFYSFLVTYKEFPKELTYEVTPKSKAELQNNAVLNEKLAHQSMKNIEQNMRQVYFSSEKPWRKKHFRKQGKKSSLLSIYTSNGHYYLHTELDNLVGAQFTLEQIQLNLIQRKSRKNTARQVRNIPLVSQYKPIEKIQGFSSHTNVLLLNGFTLQPKEKLLLEYIDTNQQHIILPIKAKHLNKARNIKQ